MPQSSNTKLQSGKPLKLTPDEQELRDRLSIKGLWDDDDVVSPEGIRIPLPPNARKPSVIVGTDLANEYEKLAKIAPEIRGRAKIITPGYTPGMINMLSKQDDPHLLDSVKPLNIQGLTTKNTGNVMVNTDWDPRENMDTLAHELHHTVSGIRPFSLRGMLDAYNEEDEARKTGKLAGKVFYDSPVMDLKNTLMNSLVSKPR